MNPELPLQIEFIPGTKVLREEAPEKGLAVVQNGPPGTSILFPDGSEVPLPSDQIVEAFDHAGAAVVGFGGMRFTELKDDRLFFERFKDLAPADQLSPERGMLMTLFTSHVQCISSYGSVLWLSSQGLH